MFEGTERFEVRGELGSGGMGVVYRAFDREMGREVALKMARRPDPGDLYRLKQEFRSRADVSHPNLLELYDLFVEGDRCFFTMELIEGGQDFMEWVRGSAGKVSLPPTFTLDPERDLTQSRPSWVAPPVRGAASDRMRRGLRQLLPALAALHSANIVHRDVKPGNVLVGPEGRVLLADFGLATPMPDAPGQDSFEGFPVGSIPYMAPEQAAGQPTTPAADLYAIGVMIYEALAGSAPFRGDALRILHQKATREAPSIEDITSDVPADLASLATDLLRREAHLRPGGEEVLERLLGGEVDSLSPGDSLSMTSSMVLGTLRAAVTEIPFVGRDSELHQLSGALARVTDERRWITVHLHGNSGIGKSMLLRRFTRGVLQRGDATVLRGRCHPQESIPFKALDAVVDSVSHHLARLSERDQRTLAPRHTGSLLRLFPVLGRVSGLRDAATTPPPDPREIRRQGFAALRDLFGRLSDRQPLLIWIDDLQWGDLDSGSLLRELVRPPDAPTALLVLSYRREDLETSPLVVELRREVPELRVPAEASAPGSYSGDFLPPGEDSGVVEIALQPLAQGERTLLAQAILSEDSEAYRRHAKAIVTESRGNPFFLCEMARYLAAAAAGSETWRADSIALADVVSPRIEALPHDSRRLLEIVSVAGRPMPRSIALEAAGLGADRRPLVTKMVAEFLLRPTGTGGEVAIAPYHDRIREATVQMVPAPRLARLHRRIAEVLEVRLPEDLEWLSRHWGGAGERVTAGQYALRAGDAAAENLAFGRAADMYNEALALLDDLEERWEVEAKRAESLANAGRGEEAGHAFGRAAASLAAAEPGNSKALWWRGRMAEHLIKANSMSDAWAVMREVLDDIGVPVPKSPSSAAWASAGLRLRLLVRGFGHSIREAEEVDPEVLTRLDVLWRIGAAMAMINHTLSDALTVRHLLTALDIGERSRVAHALANEAAFESILRGKWFRKRVGRLMETSRELWAFKADPYDHALELMTGGIIALFDADWATVVDRCEEAEEILRTECVGAHWEVGVCHNFMLAGLAMQGEMGKLRKRLHEVIRDAEIRGDRFAQDSSRMGEPAMGWLAADRPEEARRQIALAEVDTAAGEPSWPESSFRTQHYHRVVAVVNTALYEGRAEEAWTLLQDAWPRLKRAGFLKLRFINVELRQLRARVALAYAAGEIEDGERRTALKAATSDARRIGKDKLTMSRPCSELLRAATEVRRGRTERAEALLMDAIDGFDAAGMGLYREVARHRLSDLVAPEAGVIQRSEASAWMRAHGVVAPEKMVGTLAPGFPGRA